MLDRYFCCENINHDLYFVWKMLFFFISYLYGECVFVVFTLWNLLWKKRCVFFMIFEACFVLTKHVFDQKTQILEETFTLF